jgi:hypothetical protein
MPWARAQLVVNGRSIGTGAADVRKAASDEFMPDGIPSPHGPQSQVSPACGQPPERRVVTRRLGAISMFFFADSA